MAMALTRHALTARTNGGQIAPLASSPLEQPQVSALSDEQWKRSVKPSAQPTQVRTLHLPPPAETARELGILPPHGPSPFVPLGPAESRQIRLTPASPRTHSGQHPGTPGPFTGRLHRNRRRSKGPAWWSTGFRPSLVLAREGAHRIWSAGGVPCRGRLAQGRQYAPSTARPEPRSGGRGAGGSSRVRCRCQACGLSTQSNAGTRLFHAGIGVCVGMGGGGWPARCTSGLPAMYLARTCDVPGRVSPRGDR
jgi:hypothetical protein